MASFTGSSFIALVFFLLFQGSYSATLTITNMCSCIVWPGILYGAGASPLFTTGFALQPDQSNVVAVPPARSGHIWGRTRCSQDSAGKFSCITGDSGSSTVECAGGNTAPRFTLVEFALNGTGGADFYDVSLVYGFNLPVMVEPRAGTACKAIGCVVDLNVECPTHLKVIAADGEGVACNNACRAYPCLNSHFFKTACPSAHVYSNNRSFFSCVSASHYTITFCPSTSMRSINQGSNKHPDAVENLKVDQHSTLINIIGVIVALACVCSLFIVCNIHIRSSNGDCGCEMGAGTRTETTGSNSHVTVVVN